MKNNDLYIKISSLPDDLKKQVSQFVEFLLLKQKKERPSKKQRVPGKAKGLIIMQDNFDEPLEDFKAYM